MSFLQRKPTVTFLFLASLIGGGVIYALRLYWRLEFLWAYLIAVNVATAVLFCFDKAAAQNNVFRVPERVLHALTLLGGTPAAFVYSRILRHKTRKGSFQYTFWFIVFCQIAFIALFRGR